MADLPAPSSDVRAMAFALLLVAAVAYMVIRGDAYRQKRRWEFQKKWNDMGAALYEEITRG